MTDLHGRPTAAELVEAVREFLEHDVLDATEGRVRFHARVAANALAMVERELVAGDEPVLRHGRALAGLGVVDDVELAAAIRSGDFDDRWPALLSALEVSVTDRLRVANPRYLTD